MKAIRILVLALCATMVAGAASADRFARFGPYIGVNGAFGYPLFEDQVEDILGAGTELDYTWGLNTRAGLRLLSFLALEAQYEWMEGFEIKPPAASPVPNVDITGHTLTGNLKLYIPIQRVQPYLLAGFGFTKYKFAAQGFDSYTDTFFAGRVGAGADIYLTKKWAINAEASALLTASDLENIGQNLDSLSSLHYISASLGLMYRF